MTEQVQESARIACHKCGADCTSHHWMCDWQQGYWCGECFEKNPCGQGMHGEGCPTQVLQGGEA